MTRKAAAYPGATPGELSFRCYDVCADDLT